MLARSTHIPTPNKYSFGVNTSVDIISAHKTKFSIKHFFSKCDQIRIFTFTEEILNGKLHFLCSVFYSTILHERAHSISSIFIQRK